MTDLNTIIFNVALFVAIATASFVVLSAYASRVQVRKRLEASGTTFLPGEMQSPGQFATLLAVNDRIFGATPGKTTQLRLNLQRAGFFGDKAPQFFMLLRTLTMIYVPLLGYLAIHFFLPNLTTKNTLLLSTLFIFVGYILPNAILDRLKARQLDDYRTAFPDLLDMLVVCVDAGLGFEAALQRLSTQFASRSKNLGFNLMILSSELRAGRSISDAMDGLADRLGLDEVRSFSTLLKQSLELGSDIGGTLRVYSDEMRDKRAALAEERANRLPVVMVVPIGLLIFPVLMTVILYPAVVRMGDAMKAFGGG